MLAWHIRSFSKAGKIVRDYDVEIVFKLEALKRSWAGHMVRFGLVIDNQPTEPTLLKTLLFWRPLTDLVLAFYKVKLRIPDTR